MEERRADSLSSFVEEGTFSFLGEEIVLEEVIGRLCFFLERNCIDQAELEQARYAMRKALADSHGEWGQFFSKPAKLERLFVAVMRHAFGPFAFEQVDKNLSVSMAVVLFFAKEEIKELYARNLWPSLFDAADDYCKEIGFFRSAKELFLEEIKKRAEVAGPRKEKKS